MEIEITKLTSKGQIVIPQEIRKEAGIKSGERFLVYNDKDNVVLKKLENLESADSVERFETIFKRMWKTAKDRGITERDVEEEIKNLRKN